MSTSSTTAVTPAMIRGRGSRRTPGSLVAKRGCVAFRAAGTLVFRVPLTEVEAVACPWWSFGTRLVITVRGERYRITFGSVDDRYSDGDPADTHADACLLDLAIWLLEICVSLRGRFVERSAARAWRELCRPPPSCSSSKVTLDVLCRK